MILPSASLGNLEVLDGRQGLPRTGRYPERDWTRLEGVAIHHTVTPADFAPEWIARYHVTHNGWPAIGYHLLVYQDGTVVWCLDLEDDGAHVYGRNDTLWGVALVGDWTDEPPTDRHLQTSYRVVAELQTIYGDYLEVRGHRDWALPGHGTACPGNTSPDWIHHLQRADNSRDAATMGGER